MELADPNPDRRTDEFPNYYLNPFDVTKVWPDRDFSFIDLGVLKLNQNPHNYS